MKVTDEIEERLRPFEVHGVEFTGRTGSQRYGTCPFCEGEDKFYVNRKSGLWDCKTCPDEGNREQFLRRVAEMYEQQMTPQRLRQLASERHLPVDAFDGWHIGWDGQRYVIPVYTPNGSAVTDIRRYCKVKGGNRKLISTTDCKRGLLGAEHLKSNAGAPVFLFEGEWDCIAGQHLLRSVGASGVCLAAPGAGTFKPEYVPLFARRAVSLLYDHDDAGREGERRVHKLLSGSAASLKFLHWPKDKPAGYDVRDFVTERSRPGTIRPPRLRWKELRQWLRPEPRLGPSPNKTSDAPAADVGALHEAYVYVEKTAEFVNRATRERLTPQTLDRRHAAQFPLGKTSKNTKASEAFWNSEGPTVRRVAYLPVPPVSRKKFEASDPVVNVVDLEGGRTVSAINVYRPSELAMRPIPDDDDWDDLVKPWLRLIRSVYGKKDAEHLLDHMAMTVQYPHLKANWHPWIISDEGASKDTAFKPLRSVVGEHNIRDLQGRAIKNAWNEWIEQAKLLMVRDIAKLTEDDWNSAKSLFTHPPEHLQVAQRYNDLRWVPNMVHLIIMTNNDDAIPTTVDGRRLLVLHATAPTQDPEDTSKPYNADRTNRYVERADVHQAVAYFLRQRPVSLEKMRGVAPKTRMQLEVLLSTESDLAHRIRELREAERPPFDKPLFSLAEVKSAIVHMDSEDKTLAAKVTEQALGRELSRGKFATRLHRVARFKKNGKTTRTKLWTTGDGAAYESMTDVALGDAYQGR